ncbi:MAG: hypothetical protein KJ607_05215 [Bacteroidetes bacterium]|nr:hypothetical protein [Bacteroidota bacterium]
MRLIVETPNLNKFNLLAAFLRSNGYKVSVEGDIPFTDDDWALPGRPATDEEHERHARAMEKETGGAPVDVVFDRIIKKYSA